MFGASIRFTRPWVLGYLAILAPACSKPDAGHHDAAAGIVRDSSDAVSLQAGIKRGPLKIHYPFEEALFPPDIAAPTFRWEDPDPAADTWLIEGRFQDGSRLDFRSLSQDWTPSDEEWETIKQRSRESEVRFTIRGVNGRELASTLSQASITISTSPDAVEAPLFFREVNLPFLTAVKDPAAHIRWRFGPISSPGPPPIVLDKLPVCGNCHSFSADGATLAMEVDSGNDQGGYAIAPLQKRMVLNRTDIISWGDYRREDGELTFGLLCQISPDGRHVAGTVKDRALAVYRPDLTFSQLFFLVKGIIAIYDRQTKTFTALPGADDPRYVQTNATWSPDGKSLVFARAEAYEPPGLEDTKSILCPPEAAEDFVAGRRSFKYDLYRVPFNGGAGGEPEPIAGASHNGMSNYFPKFSPDGEWIVFCKAQNFMLLQPDSELYIIPARGGEARRLQGNTPRMNSWHSWSPNGKWLVFSSKAFSPYTQLFLTHIDEQGNSSVPVMLSRFTEPERAANIPEFINVPPDAIETVSAAFLDDLNYFRAATAQLGQNDLAGGIALLRKALDINPQHLPSRMELADVLFEQGSSQEAKEHLLKVLDMEPGHALAHFRLATLLREEGRLKEAAEHFRQTMLAQPDFFQAHAGLGMLLLEAGKFEEALERFSEAVRLEPRSAFSNFYHGHLLHRLGRTEEAAVSYARALEHNPELLPALLGLASLHLMIEHPRLFDVGQARAYAQKACAVTRYQDPEALNMLAGAQAVAGQFRDAVNTAKAALAIARAAGQRGLADQIQRMLTAYELRLNEKRKLPDLVAP